MAEMKIIQKTIDLLSDEEALQCVFHHKRNDEPMPSIEKLHDIVRTLRQILFPGYFGNSDVRADNVRYYMGVHVENLKRLLTEQILAGLCFSAPEKASCIKEAESICVQFVERLPQLREILITDVEAAFNGDPAATNRGEVIFCYPAIRAIVNYRIAHELLELGVPLIPRIITEMAHSETGIDIHPGAKIGESFFIDHGTGVVIGETCVIGNNVKIYQGVTLGALSVKKELMNKKRHPTIEDNVTIYAGATILGGDTIIGEGSTIGGNTWVTSSIPAKTVFTQR